MREMIEEMINRYLRRVHSLREMSLSFTDSTDDVTRARINAKKQCYETVINELDNLLHDYDEQHKT